ncbi:MAG TPA: head GIN domain-containing protein [Flavobacterium sp.]|jgi:hypothetical protein
MKKLFFIAALVLAQVSVGQVNKNLGDFDAVKVFDKINVQLIPSSENKIEITGDRSNDVETVNKNGELKIRMSLGKLLKGEEVKVKLYFKKIQSIDASEGAVITSDKSFKQTSIAITAKEGAQITVPLNVKNVKVKSVTGATIQLSGSASVQTASLGTGGVLEAKDLKTSQTTVAITTGGEASVAATDLVDAKVRAGGTILIYGSPKKINQNTVLGGSIKEVK